MIIAHLPEDLAVIRMNPETGESIVDGRWAIAIAKINELVDAANRAADPRLIPPPPETK